MRPGEDTTITHAEAATSSPAAVLARLRSRREGLSSEEAAGLLAIVGANELPHPREPGVVRKIIRQMTHLFAIMLWIAAILAWIGGLPELAVAIVVVVLINGLFSFAQEERASRAAAALARLLPQRVTVLRDGQRAVVEAPDLVPGDVMLLREGDRVSADARVLAAEHLLLDDSTLTGESERVLRDPATLEAMPSPPSDASNLVFAGTYVAAGSGQAVAFATGHRSMLGGIATMTGDVVRRRTSLQIDLDRTVAIIAACAVATGVVFFGISALRGTPLRDGFLFGVGVIVALVPEGLLPTLTLALAMSATRMAHRGALVRRPASVETLGATTVICSDKTGTMTTNEMTARVLVAGDEVVEATGLGWNPGGALTSEGHPIGERARRRIEPLLRVAALCGDAELTRDGARWRCVGDPTEGALVALARKGGVERDELGRRMPRTRAFPFGSDRMRMSTVHALTDGGVEICTKGAPEGVLRVCTAALADGDPVPLTEDVRAMILGRIDELTGRGLRVLALASRRVPGDGPPTQDDAETGLTFLGVVGLEDPIRPEVPAAIARCEGAGIRVVMITGDHPNTAASVARAAGIPAERTVLGSDLPADDQELRALLADERVGVLARIEPEQKLRIARAMQTSGHVVAMTGDGVNDGPALRQADIGVAMGITGTDVAREAADVVLLDDNLAHLVEAVEEGRAAFDNTRNFLTYHLTDNVAELAPFVLWALSGGAIPLLLSVLQVLALDIGTDLLPALALGAEPPAPDVMHRPPRGPKEHLLNRPVLLRAFGWLGPVEAVASFTAALAGAAVLLGWRPGDPLPAAGTPLATLSGILFASIVLMQMANAFECRSPDRSALATDAFSNHLLLGAVAATACALALFLYVPALASALGADPPSAGGWAIVAVTPFVLLGAEETRKAVVRRRALSARTRSA
jgi:magnesium-transporting ATPase (P-type)